MKLANIFDKVSDKMRLDFDEARAAMTHPGMKGGAFEEVFRRVLRKYLPRKLDISQGILVDSTGRTSKQLDVIISDAHATPIFFENGESRVIPAEMAYAVIEVKAMLNAETLAQCLSNMISVRDLEKSAYQPGAALTGGPFALYGGAYPAWPTNYYVFAIDSLPLPILSNTLLAHYRTEKSPLDRRIDTICVLNRGAIFNQDVNGGMNALPTPGSAIANVDTKRALLLFYALTARYWFQAETLPFNVVPYLQSMNFGENEDV